MIKKEDWQGKVVKKGTAPLGWSLMGLFFGLLLVVGPEIKKLVEWSDAMEPGFVGDMIRLSAGVGAAWITNYIGRK